MAFSNANPRLRGLNTDVSFHDQENHTRSYTMSAQNYDIATPWEKTDPNGVPNPWGGDISKRSSIWTADKLPSLPSLRSSLAAQGNSRHRENSAYSSNGFRTGAAPSTNEAWNGRTAWNDDAIRNADVAHNRSSGVSSPRKRSMAQGQPLVDTSSAYVNHRNPSFSHSAATQPNKSSFDPTSTVFNPSPQLDNVFRNPFSGNQPLRSPSDERSSAATEHIGPSSNAPSRRGSLPPSRHGEPAQHIANGEMHWLYDQQSMTRQHSLSRPTGRPYTDRNHSIQSDPLQMVTGLAELDAAIHSQRASVSIQHPHVSHPAPSASQALVRHAQNDNDQIQTRAAPSWMTNEDNDYVNGVSHEWERSTYGQYVTSQIDRRMAANPRARRQSPLEPNPPSAQVYDHLYPSAHDQNFPESHVTALVQSQYHQQRQQQQYQQGFANANVIASQQVSHLVAANNMALIHSGVAYNYPPNAIAGFNMIFTPATATVPSAMVGPVVTPPKGPKDRHTKAELRSKALNNFLNNYGQPRSKFELRYIFGHVVEFSGDQQGSRYIQERLEEGLSTEEKDALFKEIQPNALQVIMDVFGNYVIQKFFEHGDQTQKRILASYLKGRVAELSAQTYACRVVQKALERVLTDQQAELVKELEGHVDFLVKDKNGNHVIQKALECVPAEHIQFIIYGLRGKVGELAVHQYGCRVLQRLLELCKPSANRYVMNELHEQGSNIIANEYGNYVAQHVLQHGDPEDRAKMIAHIKRDFMRYARNKHGSNVVEKSLQYGSDEQRRELLSLMTATDERSGVSNLSLLIKDQFGNYVIQKALVILPRPELDEFVALLKPEVLEAKKSIHADKKLMAMEKKLQLVEQRLQSERCDSARSNSLTDLPPLSVSEAQSPQSSGLPSGNVSTIEEPVHTTPISIKTPNSDVTVVETDRTYIDEEGQPVAHASTQHVN